MGAREIPDDIEDRTVDHVPMLSRAVARNQKLGMLATLPFK
jgi:hypothetical protein